MDSRVEPQLVSFDQAAKFLGLGRTSIYKLVQDGRLKPVQVAGVRRVLFDLEDLRTFVSSAKADR